MTEAIPSAGKHGQEVKWVPVEQLLFDPENPRLEDEHSGLEQDQLAIILDELYDAREIAASIARFGYFPSEVLVGVETPDGIVIVEGNRRLTAVKGLALPELRANLSATKEWDRLATTAGDLGHIP